MLEVDLGVEEDSKSPYPWYRAFTSGIRDQNVSPPTGNFILKDITTTTNDNDNKK